MSIGLGIYVLMVEKAKAGYTGAGAVSAFAAFFIAAYLVSALMHTVMFMVADISF